MHTQVARLHKRLSSADDALLTRRHEADEQRVLARHVSSLKGVYVLRVCVCVFVCVFMYMSVCAHTCTYISLSLSHTRMHAYTLVPHQR